MNPLGQILNYIDRARSHVYRIFFFWLALLHAPIIFVALFINQNLIYQKTHLLKNEYVHDTFFKLPWWGWVLYIFVALLVPSIMTWLMIWILPDKLLKHAYAKELRDQYEREFMRVGKENELEKRKQALADKQLKTVEKENEVVQKQEELGQREQKDWEEDLRKANASGLINMLPSIERAVYEHNGRFSRYFDRDLDTWRNANVTKDELAFAHSGGLIEIDNAEKRISLTPKGLYFINQSYYNRLP